MDHHHEHGPNCGCGHDHHGHGEGCGCGQHERIKVDAERFSLTDEQAALLALIARYQYLPVARFVLESSADDEVWASALAPVTIEALDDTMEAVKQRGALLTALSDAGLLSLDYDVPIDGYDYQGYRESELYMFFQQTVAEGAKLPGAAFDRAAMDTGSMALTELGERAIGK